MASVAAGISCMGPLGGNQGHQPYPSGPSQLRTFESLDHLETTGSPSYLGTAEIVAFLFTYRVYCIDIISTL
jgi:hypothetical protein